MGELRTVDGIRAASWLVDPYGPEPFRRGSRLIEGGRIGPFREPRSGSHVVGGASTIVLPAPVDAHDHGRGLRSVSYGHVDLPFEIWTGAHGLHPSVDPGLVATVAFGRIAQGGACGTVHMHRPADYSRLVDEARAVAAAAKEIGIRLAFVVPMTDRQSLAYVDDERFLAGCGADRDVVATRLLRRRPPAREQIALADEIARAIEGPMVDVQLGPGAPQWCSDDLLTAIAENSVATGRRVHMHLLETRRQREWADAQYENGIVAHLDELGLLSPRLTVAHGVWLDARDRALLAARAVKVAVNTSSNLRLRSGLIDLGALKRCGLRFAIGLDGLSFDDDDDILREMRLAFHLNVGSGLAPDIEMADILHAATAVGREVLDGKSSGRLPEGADADLILIDRDRLVPDLVVDTGDDLAIVTARAQARHLSHVIVAGREIVRDGKVLGCDVDAAARELTSMARKVPPREDLLAFVRQHRARLRAFYEGEHHRKMM